MVRLRTGLLTPWRPDLNNTTNCAVGRESYHAQHTHTPAMCWFSPCGPSLIEKIHKFFFTLQTGSVCVIPDKDSVSSTTMSIYQHMLRVVMAKLGNKEMSPLCLSVRYRDVAMVKFWPRFGGSHQASVILWSKFGLLKSVSHQFSRFLSGAGLSEREDVAADGDLSPGARFGLAGEAVLRSHH